MKIGVLSYPLNNNYGCYLQAYALTTVLQRMGHDVVYIHRRHNKPGLKFRIKYFIKTILKDLKRFEVQNPVYRYEWLYMQKKGGKMIPFFERYVPHTDAYYTSKDLERHCQSFDAIIVGSDQVWRAGLLHHIEDYFLEFLHNPSTMRISYAASFGKKDAGYTRKEIKSCGELISKFSAVSLRESQGVGMIHDFGWNCPNPQVVLDPTLLLKKEDYQRHVLEKKCKDMVFCYILDQTEQTQEIIKKVTRRLQMEAYNILEGNEKTDYQYESIENWLGCFNSAAFVVTDSFHGTVFSILFNVPFAVMSNDSRGIDRMLSLLKALELESRLVKKHEEILPVLEETIDWTGVKGKLDQLRAHSLSFLRSSLS